MTKKHAKHKFRKKSNIQTMMGVSEILDELDTVRFGRNRDIPKDGWEDANRILDGMSKLSKKKIKAHKKKKKAAMHTEMVVVRRPEVARYVAGNIIDLSPDQYREVSSDTIRAAASVDMSATEPPFVVLHPTEEGKRRLDEIRRRRSKNVTVAAFEAKVENDKMMHYDPSEVMKDLDNILDLIKSGSFSDAIVVSDSTKIEELAKVYLHIGKHSDYSMFEELTEAIKKLIVVGKSFYEYDDQQRNIVSDSLYDGVLVKFIKEGNVEPTGIVPKTASTKKSPIKYGTLHNNMNKAYALRMGDPVPDGVKETDRIENFLIRCYQKLGISSETVIELELSPKIDGVSVNGTIRGDQLINPQTRGDSAQSVNIIGLNGITLIDDDFASNKEFGIQMEAFVTYQDREEASAYLQLDRPYVSNRHAAAGIVSRLCAAEDDELPMFISLYPIEAEGLDEENYLERMDFLQNYAIVPDDMIERKVIKGTMKELLEKIEDYFDEIKEAREKLSYSIDGMVITVVDSDYRRIIGREGRTNLFQIAYKFNPATADGVVEGIHLDSGKKGYRTIQVDLSHPVFLDGVRYDHISVLSADLFSKMGLRIGSTVTVHRVGDAIPAISLKKEGDGKVIALPKECPSCGQSLIMRNSKLFCSNPLCLDNRIGHITGFFEAIGLEGYSDAFASNLIACFSDPDETPYVYDLSTVFDLTEEDFKKFSAFNQLALEFPHKLRVAFDKCPDYKVLGALGISDLGPARAKLILRECGGTIGFIKMLRNKEFEKISKAVGYTIGEKIIASLSDDGNSCNCGYTLRETILVMQRVTNTDSSNTYELRVGHTGIGISERIRSICEKNNFEIVDGKKFDILVCGSKSYISDKMRKAIDKQRPIFTEEEFIKQYDNG